MEAAIKIKKLGKLVFVAAVVLIIVSAGVLFYGYRRCSRSCTMHYADGIDLSASSTVLSIEKIPSEGFLKYLAFGDVSSIDQAGRLVTINFVDYLNDIEINGETVEYPIVLNVDHMDPGSIASYKSLEGSVEEGYNNIYKMEVVYSQRRSLSARIKMFATLSINGLTDMDYDLSEIPTDISFSWEKMTPEELTNSCTRVLSERKLADIGFDALTRIIDQYEKAEVPSIENESEEYDPNKIDPRSLVEIMSLSSKVICDTCDDSCTLADYNQVGLDPLYFPLTVSLLEEYPENGNDMSDLSQIADKIIGSLYYDKSLTREAIIDNVNWAGIGGDNPTPWASEPICLMYLLTNDLDNELFSRTKDLSKAICFATGQKNTQSIEEYIEENDYDQSNYGDETFLLDALGILSGEFVLSEKYELEHTTVWLKLAGDNYVYGYESGNDSVVSAGNERVLQGLAALRDDFDSYGDLNNYPSRLDIKRVVRSILVKRRYLAEEDANELLKILDEIKTMWGDDVFVEVYLNESGWVFPDRNVDTEGFASIDHLLELYLLDPEVYESMIDRDVSGSVEKLFAESYISNECGKVDYRLFGTNSTNGQCTTLSLNSSQNLRIIHNLLIQRFLDEI